MSDWPASADAIRHAQGESRWHESGAGPFALVTRAYITRDGGLEDFVCVHRFQSPADREAYRVAAERSGLRVEVVA